MDDPPESIVRAFLAQRADPVRPKLAAFFADEAVWVDGPNGVHRGAIAALEDPDPDRS